MDKNKAQEGIDNDGLIEGSSDIKTPSQEWLH